MSDEDDTGVPQLMTMLLIGFALGVTVFLPACSSGRHEVQVEAVEHGAAHWEADKTGATTFHWNDEKAEKP